MWTQEPTELLAEAVRSPVQSPAAGTCHCIRLPAAEQEVAAVAEVAAVGELAAVEEVAAVEELVAVEELAVVGELAAVEKLAAVRDQWAGLVPSWEEASGPVGST